MWEDELVFYIGLIKDFVFKDYSVLNFVEFLKFGLIFFMNERFL